MRPISSSVLFSNFGVMREKIVPFFDPGRNLEFHMILLT